MPVILVWIYTDQKLEVILIFKCDFLFRDKAIALQLINQLLNLHRDRHSKQSVLLNCFEIKRGPAHFMVQTLVLQLNDHTFYWVYWHALILLVGAQRYENETHHIWLECIITCNHNFPHTWDQNQSRGNRCQCSTVLSKARVYKIISHILIVAMTTIKEHCLYYKEQCL